MRSLSVLLHVLAIVARVLAIVLAMLVVALCFPSVGGRGILLGITNTVTSLIPSSLSGILVIVTPFGGAFRGDFALVSLALFVIDWILMRASAALR